MENRDQGTRNALGRITRLGWVAVMVVLVYMGWTFYARHKENRDYARQASEKELADARFASEVYGGNRLEILNFAAPAATVRRGEKTKLCYSVSNAKKVTILPDINDVRPSYSNCVEATVKIDTTYTLTIADERGNTKTASITIQAR